MSRKRHSQRSKGGNPQQGIIQSRSTQQANCEDSLTTECLIRTFMDKGNMEDQILKTLFIDELRLKDRESKGIKPN
ncbi:unnamed protein product (macronuclear) [Paramecium tetraurelia]|uniref:Uncharacterized protein n=1 Tax=Paramecium tetraurelia TaxID=5888 RepID=A0BRH8_PARTE|nr:uncharacterized protein GSPATT00031376001 [Paramecium tetraurelia]CAK61145.1 unnamed protein product [Paramecium tetraurelia]|eukprot:XP_001428543.1 hypothetical protein (macronuclear) [Paramecium tetraurelia strain d4-2]